MKADAYDLTKVFGYDRQLFAPLFQRPYVWEEEKQWKPLWEDIKGIAEELLIDEQNLRPHFLGAVVLEQFRVPVGKPDARSIIDGQQRLTTIQIFLAALRDVCIPEENLTKLGRSVERLIFNDESVVDDEIDRYKVWPTNMDQSAYSIIMKSQSPEEAKKELQNNDESHRSNIADAYFYFYRTIKEWVSESDEISKSKVQALVNTIKLGLRLVVVDMDSKDNAQLIFETLNARGTPLLPSDLVKNFLFHKARENQLNVEELYKSYWHHFDLEHRFWREEISQGRLKRPRIDLLLNHYLTLQKNDEVSARSLFQEFQLISKSNSDKNSEWYLKSLKKHSVFFKHFLTIQPDTREGTFFFRLKIMDTTTVFPFLLGLYEDFEVHQRPKENKIAILITLESYLIRRMVCRLTTKNYNRFFLDLLSKVKKDDHFSIESVKAFLSKQTSDTNKWPTDEEFRRAWLKVPIYHAITRPRLRMILVALDKGLHSSKTEPYTVSNNLTVEHLTPQLWKDHWPLPEVGNETYDEQNIRVEQRNQLIQTIGNLFYLTKSLNPYVSNGPFDKKKQAILEHSAININRRFLENTDEWNESSIVKRSEDLFEVALKLWPGPDERYQELTKPLSSSSEILTKEESSKKLDETDFFNKTHQNIGEDATSALKAFYNMAISSQYVVKLQGDESNGCFKLYFPQLCTESIIIVHSNGKIDVNFKNIRGTEDAVLFGEILFDELNSEMGFDIPETSKDQTYTHSTISWTNQSDILMEILDNLLSEYIDLVN